MSSIVVSPLSRLRESLDRHRPGRLVSILTRHTETDTSGLPPDMVLRLAFSDLGEPMEGHVLASEADIAALIAFVRAWDGAAPFLIHCYAGVSRSTAAAYVALCALRPDLPEAAAAARLRAASPTATPNPRIVALADAALGRAGRMRAAIAAIGRGADCYEGMPFCLSLDAGGGPGADQIPAYQS